MLQWWLRVDPIASWGKLLTVIESPAVCSGEAVDPGDYNFHKYEANYHYVH